MIEENLLSKMSEFMTALDQVKKYKTIVSTMTDFILIIVGFIFIALSFYIVTRLSLIFFGFNYLLSTFGAILFTLLFPAGIFIGIYWVRRKVKSVKAGQWKNTLKEGVPGVIKLIEELEWENIFSDIRSAKLGFFLYGVFRILAYWSLAIVFLLFFSGLVGFVFHMNVDLVVILLFSLVVVLILNRSDLGKRYRQIGRLDWLLWELRWFESEFRGADFEA